MISDTYAAIRSKLVSALAGIPIKMPNIGFDKPDGTWVELYDLNRDMTPATMGKTGENDVNQAFQITVVTKLNIGTKEAESVLNKIASEFQIGSALVYNETKSKIKSLSFGPSFESDGVWKSICTVYCVSRFNRGI